LNYKSFFGKIDEKKDNFKMHQDISDKKIFIYSIGFYSLLFLIELYADFFNYISDYSKCKLSTTFITKIKESLSLIRINIVIYVGLLLFLYFLTALLNYHYVKLAYKALTKNRKESRIPLKAFLFMGINVMFIFIVYSLNFTIYPSSKVTRFLSIFLNNNHYFIYYVIFLVFLGLYFLIFIFLCFRFGTKKIKIIAPFLIGLILLSNLDPCFYAKNLWTNIAPGKKINSGPNLIFIGMDSLNPDHTKYFGYPYNTTPHLDEFMEKNLVFSNCYTPLARTFPSWYSILTGKYPKSTGVRYNLIKRNFISPDAVTIPQYLKNNYNYFTAYFTDETRFCNITTDDGFDYLRHPVMGVKDFIFGNFHDFSLTNVFLNNPLGYKIFKFTDINRAIYHMYNPRFFRNDLCEFVDKLKKKERFLLTVHFCAPHWPYDASSPYPYLFDTKENVQYGSYDGTLKMADDQVGKFIKVLKKKGLYDNSIIIILSDHGETIGGHGTNLKDSAQNRILLTIKPQFQSLHKEINDLVKTIDIAPTVYEFLNIETSLDFDGKSLLPLIKGGGKIPRYDPIIMETGFSIDTPGGAGLALQEMVTQGIAFYEFDRRGIITVQKKFNDILVRRKQRALQTAEWKLVLEPQVRGEDLSFKIQLFSLKDDPLCKNDVSDKYPEICSELFQKLRNHYRNELQ
jgi:arylsulfatase A-like enzyme